MGIDTCAIIENHQDVDRLRTFCEQLNGSLQLAVLMREFDTTLRGISPRLLPDLAMRPWELVVCRTPEEIDPKRVAMGWDAGYFVECQGPFGAVCVYEHLAEISWYMCRWYAFLQEPQFRAPLLQATHLISSLLNPGHDTIAIFVPDSTYDESLALDELHQTMPEMLAWLKSKCGPPAERFESIVQESEDGMYSSKGYYVARRSASDFSN